MDRLPSIPLIVQDPYISIWSPYDTLMEGDTAHWSGLPLPIRGYVTVGNAGTGSSAGLGEEKFRFMGAGTGKTAVQKDLRVTATKTVYTMEAGEAVFTVSFLSPFILEDPCLTARPCTYIDIELLKGSQAKVELVFTSQLVTNSGKPIVGADQVLPAYKEAWMRNVKSAPLSESGDNVTIDWGCAYLAVRGKNECVKYEAGELRFKAELTQETPEAHLVFAFDDGYSINYFGEMHKGLWTKRWKTIRDAITAALDEHEALCAACVKVDETVREEALAAGGKEYAALCEAAYRHTIAAHKLIEDEDGKIVFLSKENDSNGCIGTVDVSYPSIPLYLLHNTEYVKGMMRPVFKFAACPVWEYDFAPHDVGRYPFATGQVYGTNPDKRGTGFDGSQGSIYTPFAELPAGGDWYIFRNQMPVEECGNMLLMCALTLKIDGDVDFVKDKVDVLKQWAGYLLRYGQDPGEQLCTDDFAGHLAHNINLSAKAILGVKGFALIMKVLGDEEAYRSYLTEARKMAAAWQEGAAEGDHTKLTFGSEDTWSLKYNLVMDRLLGDERLFDQAMIERDVDYYIKKQNTYGVPLDCRATYTKSDWILWACGLTDDKEKRSALIRPLAQYLRETKTRYPFSDWYDTVTGDYEHFKGRSVQGGIFMPILTDRL